MIKRSKVQTIGSVEILNFPELQISNVPSKVDTGADNSSIWASNIVITNGVLKFTLFGPGSRFYTGEQLSSTEYQTTAIKNSFGVTEFRYKVKFLVHIGSRKIRAWFTLSDRSEMTYPVLIGKKFLKNKYVVDVSRHKVHGGSSQAKSVLVVASKTQDLDKLFKKVKSLMKTQDVRFAIRGYDQLAFNIGPRSVKVIETKGNKDLNSFDMVYFKSHKSNYPFAISAARYLKFHNIKFFDKELLSHVAYDKLSEYMKLALYGLPVPRTVSGSTSYLLKNLETTTDKLNWPLVCKEINSDRGKKNYLVLDKKELRQVLKDSRPGDLYALQSFIPNNGYLRAFVFGRQAALVVYRAAAGHADPRKKHLNAPVGSSNATLIEEAAIDPQVRDLAIKASELMNRQVAGVDIIQNKKTKKWYLLEVNGAPQIKTGSFLRQKESAIAQFIDNEINR